MKNSRPLVPSCLLALVAFACQNDNDGDTFLTPGANSLGLLAATFRMEGDLLVANVVEELGVDLNGDGDFTDAVIETVDLGTGRKAVLPYAAIRGFELGAGFVAFTVNESAQREDLDGDGDVFFDNVLFVHDTSTGRTTNLALAVRSVATQMFLTQEGPLLAFTVSEAEQGQDLDGDGLLTRDLVFTYEADIGRMTPLFAASSLRPILEDGRVFVAAEEQGYGDKNGDGDTDDNVLLVHDVRSGVSENLSRAVQFAGGNLPLVGVDGALLALGVNESAQGLDLNADGDLHDVLVEIRDLESGLVRPTNLPVNGMWVEGGLVGLYVPEDTDLDFVGTDYDDDGDMLDTVAFFYDGFTDTLTNTAVTVEMWSGNALAPALGDRRAGFLASEIPGDLNGDGDNDDHVLQLFDARTGVTRSTGIAAWREGGVLDIDASHAACVALEGVLQPGALALDLASGTQQSFGFSVGRLDLAEERLLLFASEFAQDLDGDGDRLDIVPLVHDLRTGRTFNTRVAALSSSHAQLTGGRLAVHASEFAQGRDLNGDGDLEDVVLSVVVLP